MTPKNIWVISELYYPELTSTGYFLTKIAEGLADSYNVSALCGQPTYAARGTRAPTREVLNGVRVYRCSGTVFDKDSLPLRLINNLTLAASMLAHAVWKMRSQDCLLVVTNPPFLPLLMWVVRLIRRPKCILLIHDFYPDVLIVTGLVQPNSWIARCLGKMNSFLYRKFDSVIVLGRDAAELISRKIQQRSGRIHIIPNWADLREVHPMKRSENRMLQSLALEENFVVQYAGNAGRTHDVESLIDAATILRGHASIRFLFVCWGAKKNWLQGVVTERKLSNVILLPNVPRSDLCTMLNACDIAAVSLIRGMAGISVPSRLYNIMAAGKPILAIVEAESEIAKVVTETSIGWVVQPEDAQSIAGAILEAFDRRFELAEVGLRARRHAELTYSFANTIEFYQEIINSIDNPRIDPAL